MSAVAVLLGAAIGGSPAIAQRLSPHESTSATIDGANVQIVYGRPAMRGRKIFGGLIQYGRVWTPGADEVTRLTTSKAIRLGNLDLAMGSYAFWMQPTESTWTLIVNSDWRAFHTFHDPSSDVGRVPLEKRSLDAPVEQLTFTIEPNTGGGGWIRMSWETTQVSAPFTVVE
jgi:hypothetical protein